MLTEKEYSLVAEKYDMQFAYGWLNRLWEHITDLYENGMTQTEFENYLEELKRKKQFPISNDYIVIWPYDVDSIMGLIIPVHYSEHSWMHKGEGWWIIIGCYVGSACDVEYTFFHELKL